MGMRFIDFRGRERFYDENGKSIPCKPKKNIDNCFEVQTIPYIVTIPIYQSVIKRNGKKVWFADEYVDTEFTFVSGHRERQIRKQENHNG